MEYKSYGVIVIKELLPLFPNTHLQQKNIDVVLTIRQSLQKRRQMTVSTALNVGVHKMHSE